MKYRKIAFLLILIIPIIVLTGIIYYSISFHTIRNIPSPQHGLLDMSNVDLNNSNVFLNGEWEFYWNKYIITDNLQNEQHDGISKIPSLWKINNKNNGK